MNWNKLSEKRTRKAFKRKHKGRRQIQVPRFKWIPEPKKSWWKKLIEKLK